MTDKPDLRERVAQLEQTVQQQAKIIDDYLPDDPRRRKFLTQGAKGVGAVAGLGLAYDLGTESAEAATGDFDVGVPGDRATLYAAEVLDDNETKLVDFPNGGPAEFPQGVSTDDRQVTNLGCQIFLDSDTSIPANTQTKVPFNNVRVDDRDEFDTSANQFTASEDGRYSLKSFVRFENMNDGDDIQFFLVKNGSIQFAKRTVVGPGLNSIGLSQDIELVASDTLSASVRHNSSSSRTLTGRPSGTWSNLSITFLG